MLKNYIDEGISIFKKFIKNFGKIVQILKNYVK